MTTQLREAQKEADGDLWEQENIRVQTLMTNAALFLAGSFTLLLEGDMPLEAHSRLLLGVPVVCRDQD